MRSVCHPSRPRSGYTLLEMLILVALIAMVAGLSWPALSKLSQKRELLESARHVRVALLRTRLEAIETGTARQFSYQVGTGVFESSVFSPTADMTVGTSLPDAALPTGLQPESDPASTSRDEAGGTDQPALPPGVFFVDPLAESPLDTESVVDGEQAPDAAWSTPIPFYPTGRALNARMQLSNGNYTVDVTLRGLTGTVRIGQVRRLVEPGEDTEGGSP